jgi:hypothetical protein
LKVLFGMALRQTTGFVESLLRLVGLNWAVPDFSTLSRRPRMTEMPEKEGATFNDVAKQNKALLLALLSNPEERDHAYV